MAHVKPSHGCNRGWRATTLCPPIRPRMYRANAEFRQLAAITAEGAVAGALMCIAVDDTKVGRFSDRQRVLRGQCGHPRLICQHGRATARNSRSSSGRGGHKLGIEGVHTRIGQYELGDSAVLPASFLMRKWERPRQDRGSHRPSRARCHDAQFHSDHSIGASRRKAETRDKKRAVNVRQHPGSHTGCDNRGALRAGSSQEMHSFRQRLGSEFPGVRHTRRVTHPRTICVNSYRKSLPLL